MLAIDTNLIVRYLVGDDAGQAARARRLIDNTDIFVFDKDFIAAANALGGINVRAP